VKLLARFWMMAAAASSGKQWSSVMTREQWSTVMTRVWRRDAVPLRDGESTSTVASKAVTRGMFWVFEHPRNFREKLDTQKQINY